MLSRKAKWRFTRQHTDVVVLQPFQIIYPGFFIDFCRPKFLSSIYTTTELKSDFPFLTKARDGQTYLFECPEKLPKDGVSKLIDQFSQLFFSKEKERKRNY